MKEGMAFSASMRRSTDTQTSPHLRVSPRVAAFRKQNIFNFSRLAVAAASDSAAKKLQSGVAPPSTADIYTVLWGVLKLGTC